MRVAMPSGSLQGTVCLLAWSIALAGCAVGPDYGGPAPVARNSLRATSFAHITQASAVSAPAPAAWWLALDDPELSALVDTALANSPTIHAGQARLRQARAGLNEQRRNELPKATASAVYLHADLPSSSLGVGPLNLYDIGMDASWEIDLFGGTRRAIEAASAEAGAVGADLEDTHVQLAAEVAVAYVDLRDRQQRVALIRSTAELEQQMLDLAQQRRASGVASQLDVERVRAQVQNTRASLIPLDAQITESLDQLAVLTGREPGGLDAELGAMRPLPMPPNSVAVGDPASLLRQRPDIRAAERRLASQNAQIGERKAAWFPKLTLMGNLGFSAAEPGHLVSTNNFSWFGLPYLQWNALDFGRVQARVEQAKAGRDLAQAQYESTVLGALRDADVALARFGQERQHAVSLREVEGSAGRAAALTQQRYHAGAATALDWLDAERTRFAAEQNRVASDAQVIKYYVALQKSLGLGWLVQPTGGS